MAGTHSKGQGRIKQINNLNILDVNTSLRWSFSLQPVFRRRLHHREQNWAESSAFVFLLFLSPTPKIQTGKEKFDSISRNPTNKSLLFWKKNDYHLQYSVLRTFPACGGFSSHFFFMKKDVKSNSLAVDRISNIGVYFILKVSFLQHQCVGCYISRFLYLELVCGIFLNLSTQMKNNTTIRHFHDLEVMLSLTIQEINF